MAEKPAASGKQLGTLRPKTDRARVVSSDPCADNPLPLIARRMAAITKEVIEVAASIVKGQDHDDSDPDHGDGPGRPDHSSEYGDAFEGEA